MSSTLNRDIQFLYLSGNNLTKLNEQEFDRKNFRNLQKLFLNSNELVQIHASAFYKLTGLIELDLSENFLPSIFSSSINSSNHQLEQNEQQKQKQQTDNEKQIMQKKKLKQNKRRDWNFLKHLTQLRHLNMNANKLTELESGSFIYSSHLRHLSLSK